jgi:hypothetical protein
MPSCCRAIALVQGADSRLFTVYVPVATGQQTIANVATTRRLAIVCSRPTDHSTMQLKGTTSGVRVAREDERELVAGRVDQFADALAQLGMPRRVTRRLAHWPAFAIDVAVEEIYEQTPGPQAGVSLQ